MENEQAQEQKLGEFLEGFEGVSGVYFLTPEQVKGADDKILVKIGLSRAQTDTLTNKKYGGLGRRLDSYLLCYPRGYLIFAVMQTQGKYAYKLEKWLHSYFTSKKYKAVYNHSRVEEWYHLSPTDIYSTLAAIMRSTDIGGCITKHNIYQPAVFVDTNGRVAQHPKKAMPGVNKANFESFFSPGKVPETLKPNRRPIQEENKYDEDDDQMTDIAQRLEFGED